MNKRYLLLGCLFLFICCCGSVLGGVLLFGNFEVNNNCIYKGPLANNLTGSCAQGATDDRTENVTTSSSVYTSYSGKESDKYTFEYIGENFEVVDGSAVVLYSKLSSKDSNGFRSNININYVTDNFAVTNANCRSYAEQIINALDGLNGQIDIVDSTTVQLDSGKQACRAEWDLSGSKAATNLTQVQFVTTNGREVFVITLTAPAGDDVLVELEDIARSFAVK